MIEIRLFGSLRRFAEDPSPFARSVAHVEWRQGDTVAAVLRRLGIDPAAEVANIFLNGRYHYNALDLPVEDGTRLSVFPKNMAMLYC